MTDFFADLEREIRAAHPRRPRPVVPVKGLAVTAAVAATLVAIVLGIGALSGAGEREHVAAPPQQLEEGWTAYAPDCGGGVVDGRIPDDLVDRFAILRGEPQPVTLPDEKVPEGIAAVVRQSLRPVAGPEDGEYVFAVARLAGENCEPTPAAPCLIDVGTQEFTCASEGQPGPLMTYLISDGRVLAVLAEDSVGRARVEVSGHATAEIELEANTGFYVMPPGGDDPEVTAVAAPEQAIQPLAEGENCTSDIDELQRHLAAFDRPVAPEAASMDVTAVRGNALTFLDLARIFEAHGSRYVVFPGCDTTVCMWREGSERTVCQGLPSAEQGRLVLAHHIPRGGEVEIAGLVTRGSRAVRYGDVQAELADGFFHVTIPSGEGAAVEIEPGS